MTIQLCWIDGEIPMEECQDIVHAGNLIQPRNILLQNKSSRFLLHGVTETKSRTAGGDSSPY